MKIVYDGDFGIDDAIALLYLTTVPEVEVLAVGSVNGNTNSAQAADNAVAALDVAGLDNVPVYVGAALPLGQPHGSAAAVHGDDGFGGQAPRPSRSPISATSAAEQLVRTVRDRPGQCTVVATGPLTNLALAVLIEPRLPSLVRSVVVMGGALEAPGNVTPWAEFNIASDPEAADLVFGAGLPLILVGLDVTLTAWLRDDELTRITAGAGRRARFCWSILEHYLDSYSARYGSRGCPLHDPTAAVLAVEPQLASYTDARVAVGTMGATRGMLLTDRRHNAAVRQPPAVIGERPPIRVATDLDSVAVVSRVTTSMLV